MASSQSNPVTALRERVTVIAEENPFIRSIIEMKGQVRGNRLIQFSLFWMALVALLAIFGEMITPYDYAARHYDASGELMRRHPPSTDHLLGTTEQGQDVLSRVIYGAQPTMLVGLLGGSLIVSIGLTVGVVAGYFGGYVDEGLMRLLDVLYGIPFLPFAIVLMAYFGIGFWTTILLIGALLWRGNARVFRSQVLQIKERSYVKSARASGASHLYIMLFHILPNMIGMIILFLALGIGVSILLAAGLAFLGFMNPFVPSWGVIIRSAYDSGFLMDAWWWSLPPGFMISFTILSCYLIGREYERLQEEKTEREAL